MQQYLSVVGAVGGAITTLDGLTTITGFAPFDFNKLTAPVVKQDPVAETLQVSTLTPTLQNNTYYYVTIRARSKNGGTYKYWTFRYLSDSTAAAAEINDAFATSINSNTDIPVTAVGGATLVLTGESGFTVFQVYASQNYAVVLTTPGVIAVGQGTLILRDSFLPTIPNGNAANASITAGEAYVIYQWFLDPASVAGGGQMSQFIPQQYFLLVDSDNAAFIALLDALFGT